MGKGECIPGSWSLRMRRDALVCPLMGKWDNGLKSCMRVGRASPPPLTVPSCHLGQGANLALRPGSIDHVPLPKLQLSL